MAQQVSIEKALSDLKTLSRKRDDKIRTKLKASQKDAQSLKIDSADFRGSFSKSQKALAQDMNNNRASVSEMLRKGQRVRARQALDLQRLNIHSGFLKRYVAIMFLYVALFLKKVVLPLAIFATGAAVIVWVIVLIFEQVFG